MGTASAIINNIVPISDFSRGKASQIFSKAAPGAPITVVKNNRPAAIVTSVDDYNRLAEAEENYLLLCEALDRMARSGGLEGRSLDDVLSASGISQTELDAVGDVEFE